MDGSIYSSHIYANAALRQGWIEPGSKRQNNFDFLGWTYPKNTYFFSPLHHNQSSKTDSTAAFET